ncbi:MAG: SDR family oxidoreductase [Opitutales bacterium]|nr:SDR family oxidoreductase [Opitutales bacterium]
MSQPFHFIGGITGGVGRALAERLAASGATVAGYARTAEDLSDIGVEKVFEADARDSGAVGRVFKEAENAFGTPTGYAHCIGSVFLKPVHTMKDEEWTEVIATNLTTAFYALRAAVTAMRREKAGSIVLVSSVAARFGLPSHEAIAAAKGGVEGLVRAASASYANFGVRVNGVAPGLVETGATKHLLGSEQARKMSASMHPLGRIGAPDEVASLMAWLLSEDAAWVSGQVWSIDGGMGGIMPKPRAG